MAAADRRSPKQTFPAAERPSGVLGRRHRIGSRLSSLCGVVCRVPWPHVWLLSAIAVATTHKWLIRRAGILLTLVVKRTTSLDLTWRICRRCASQHGPALKFPAELGQERC